MKLGNVKFSAVVKDGALVLTIPLTDKPFLSKSEKTIHIVEPVKELALVNGETVTITAQAYCKNRKYAE